MTINNLQPLASHYISVLIDKWLGQPLKADEPDWPEFNRRCDHIEELLDAYEKRWPEKKAKRPYTRRVKVPD